MLAFCYAVDKCWAMLTTNMTAVMVKTMVLSKNSDELKAKPLWCWPDSTDCTPFWTSSCSAPYSITGCLISCSVMTFIIHTCVILFNDSLVSKPQTRPLDASGRSICFALWVARELVKANESIILRHLVTLQQIIINERTYAFTVPPQLSTVAASHLEVQTTF